MSVEPKVSVQLIKRMSLFQNLNETEVRQIAEIMTLEDASPGDVIHRQGEQTQDLWIVIEGTCEVVRVVPPAGEVPLATIEPSGHFGEMSFFHPAPHSADVRAKTPVKLIRIKYHDYKYLIEDGVWAAYKLAYNVVDSMASRLRRMDDWVTELQSKEAPEEIRREWSKFRETLLSGWHSSR